MLPTDIATSQQLSIGARLAVSRAATDTATSPAAGFRRWFAEYARTRHYRVLRAPLNGLPGWSFQPGTGDLVHESGRFFSVTGLRVGTDFGGAREWRQPIISQPEVGMLGLLLKDFDGVLHCLVQAKMEPGNVNSLQLSPTVQATRSNYTGAHHGRAVPYLEYFTGPGRGTVVADSLQSEQGWWFLHKRNRNMVVETEREVPLVDGFRWLTLGQLGALLRRDHLVNMDTRTVLATLPGADSEDVREAGPTLAGRVRGALDQDAPLPLPDVLSRLTDARFRYQLLQERIPLDEVLGDGWHRSPDVVSRTDGRHFSVLGVTVEAEEREVARWAQPLLAPAPGLAGLLVRRVGGVPQVLLHTRVEAGCLNVAEFAPTVQCAALPSPDRAPGARHPFVDRLLSAPPEHTLYDTLLSEEGGRFHHAVTRYLIVEVSDDHRAAVPEDYCWVTLPQARALIGYGNTVNVQARTLLACLMWAR
ncbi:MULTISPECIES: NDP-hexose 2,3-dehydratase family protein [unclassified Streptomyces]|uniref:NDP-hexose 2,3-dehydratase family protein n=1 Tax=unclassified Streptomyces TaxID=2593676 RepID=UPI002E7700CB|nr:MULTISPECIES: NDP-hexose 2,3-dehydratase family protein [unclassified Streptomyces]MEE1758248.1 NDP-hexose 2,3-dehydratase family protein [Streptomyces sp. SP18BB07]MEE1832696.1 NDP-hexose 2,3-dehydratase family protein [Streptomyces sp. SP17KL33]